MYLCDNCFGTEAKGRHTNLANWGGKIGEVTLCDDCIQALQNDMAVFHARFNESRVIDSATRAVLAESRARVETENRQ